MKHYETQKTLEAWQDIFLYQTCLENTDCNLCMNSDLCNEFADKKGYT